MCTLEGKKEFSQSEYREELLRMLDASHKRLIKTVANFNAKTAIVPINIKDLNDYPFMVWVELNEYVKIRRRANRFGDYLCFDTKMIKGGEFGEHFHTDIIESAEVIYGELLDTSDSEVYKSGDVAHYEKGIKHTPVATTDTLLHVLFKPN